MEEYKSYAVVTSKPKENDIKRVAYKNGKFVGMIYIHKAAEKTQALVKETEGSTPLLV